MLTWTQSQREAATKIALDAKVLALCPDHEEVYDPLLAPNRHAYKLGKSLFAAGKLQADFSDITELKEAIRDVIDQAGMECCVCAKQRDLRGAKQARL